MQRERQAKHLRRVKRVTKFIIWVILIGVPFTIGFTMGRITKHTAPTPVVESEAYQVSAEPVDEYAPDPCGLEVVVCEGEEGYNIK